jgi:hypothetical protein
MFDAKLKRPATPNIGNFSICKTSVSPCDNTGILYLYNQITSFLELYTQKYF